MHQVTPTIKLNVGGTIFTTTRSTLCMSPYLASLLEKEGEEKKHTIFIDENPSIFKHVLNVLRDINYPFSW